MAQNLILARPSSRTHLVSPEKIIEDLRLLIPKTIYLYYKLPDGSFIRTNLVRVWEKYGNTVCFALVHPKSVTTDGLVDSTNLPKSFLNVGVSLSIYTLELQKDGSLWVTDSREPIKTALILISVFEVGVDELCQIMQ